MPQRIRLRSLGVALMTFATLASAGLCDLQSAIDAVAARGELANGLVGVAVCDPTTGAVLCEHNGGKAMLPASTMKTVSCAYALENLGPDYTYATTARAVEVREGTVQGPLYLVGSGDPSTDVRDLAELAEATYQAGIRSVPEGIAADVSHFAGRRWRSGWTADDFIYSYGAWPDALNLNHQTVSFTVTPGDEGELARVTWNIPEAPFEVTHEALTVGPTDTSELWVDRSLDSNHFSVTGTIAEGAEPRVFVRAFVDPGLVAVHVFATQLRNLGVTVGSSLAYAAAPTPASEIARIESPPLSTLVSSILKTSDNLGAELMLWTTGVEQGAGPTFSGAMASLTRWLESRGMPLEGVRLTDGSGLSRYNYLTPRFLANHLAALVASPSFRVFRACLPVAGVDGTLVDRFHGSVAEGKVSAKTGSMSRVSCLAGYAPRADGALLAFAIMLNGHDCPQAEVYRAQEDILVAIMTEGIPG